MHTRRRAWLGASCRVEAARQGISPVPTTTTTTTSGPDACPSKQTRACARAILLSLLRQISARRPREISRPSLSPITSDPSDCGGVLALDAMLDTLDSSVADKRRFISRSVRIQAPPASRCLGGGSATSHRLKSESSLLWFTDLTSSLARVC